MHDAKIREFMETQIDDTLGYARRSEGTHLILHSNVCAPTLTSCLLTNRIPRRFILYLEPSPNSKLAKSILEFYRLSHVKVGPNEAHLYHPHCSMTGFFSLPADRVDTVLASIKSCISCWLASPLPPPTLDGLIARDSSLNLKLKGLVDELAPLVCLRPKDLDHISLAYLNKHVKSPRSLAPAEISILYELACTTISTLETLPNALPWDIALYELVHESHDLTHPHLFEEVVRWHAFDPESNPIYN
ncbi:hypothetical protein L0F63_007371 [Massospora cicadina]|nr:hypothetical protein L0F63_007371 [Massospora cicadina]